MMYSTAPLSSSRPRSNTTTSDAVSDITMMTTQQPSIVSCSSYSYSFSVPSPNYVKNNNNCEIINIINANNANNANNNNNNNTMSTTIISDNNNTRMSNSNSINSANTNTITNSIHPEKNIMKRNRRDKTATNIAVGACIGTIILPIPVLGTIVGATVAGYTTNAILKKKNNINKENGKEIHINIMQQINHMLLMQYLYKIDSSKTFHFIQFCVAKKRSWGAVDSISVDSGKTTTRKQKRPLSKIYNSN